MTSFDDNWERAEGDPCKRCGKLVLRFTDGICTPCYTKGVQKSQDKIEERAFIKGLREEILGPSRRKAKAARDYWKAQLDQRG